MRSFTHEERHPSVGGHHPWACIPIEALLPGDQGGRELLWSHRLAPDSFSPSIKNPCTCPAVLPEGTRVWGPLIPGCSAPTPALALHTGCCKGGSGGREEGILQASARLRLR